MVISLFLSSAAKVRSPAATTAAAMAAQARTRAAARKRNCFRAMIGRRLSPRCWPDAMRGQPVLRALILALGMTAAGWLVGRGFIQGRIGDRFVTVRGISERQVEANLALWPLRVVAADN